MYISIIFLSMRWMYGMFKPFSGIIYWCSFNIGGQTKNKVPLGDEFLRWDTTAKQTHKCWLERINGLYDHLKRSQHNAEHKDAKLSQFHIVYRVYVFSVVHTHTHTTFTHINIFIFIHIVFSYFGCCCCCCQATYISCHFN